MFPIPIIMFSFFMLFQTKKMAVMISDFRYKIIVTKIIQGDNITAISLES